MALCYIGETGGYGTFGANRAVFSSDVAAPRIRKIFAGADGSIVEELAAAKNDSRVRAALRDPHVARRFEVLQDIAAGVEQA
jgi:hypothetical protein